MSKSRESIPQGAWPRLLRQDMAAAYLDISAGKLRTDVKAGILPRPAIVNPPRWDRDQIDAWLDGKTVNTTRRDQLLSRLG